MTGIIIKFIAGLFILLILPALITPNKGKNKKQIKAFIHITTKTIGVVVIVYAAIDLVRFLLNYK